MKKFTIFSAIMAVIALAVFVELYSSGYITSENITGEKPVDLAMVGEINTKAIQANILGSTLPLDTKSMNIKNDIYKSFSTGASVPDDIDEVSTLKVENNSTDKQNDDSDKETIPVKTDEDSDKKVSREDHKEVEVADVNTENKKDPIFNFEDILKEQLIERIDALPIVLDNGANTDINDVQHEDIQKIAKILSKNPENRTPVDFEDVGYSFLKDVPVTIEMFRKAGFKNAIATDTIHNGLLFKIVDFTDMPGVTAKKTIIQSDDEMFAMLYEFTISQQTSSQNVFNALKTRLSGYIGTDSAINMVTDFGNEAFYFNDPARPMIAFLTFMIQNSIYAISYPKTNHPQILNLTTLLELEF